MDGGGRSNLQPPFVRDYPPARDNLPPPLTDGDDALLLDLLDALVRDRGVESAATLTRRLLTAMARQEWKAKHWSSGWRRWKRSIAGCGNWWRGRPVNWRNWVFVWPHWKGPRQQADDAEAVDASDVHGDD